MSRIVRGCALLVVVSMLAVSYGCKNNPPPEQMGQKSLYERLGGQQAIAAVVDDFVNRAAGDERVNFTRKGHPNHWDPTPENVAKLKEHLTQFVVQATGGPQEYHGADMVTVHKGMEITDAEFSAAADDLSKSLDKFNVPQKEHDELMAVVASTHDQIVGK